MKKINKIFLCLALILLSIPMFTGCATSYAKYINYETKLESDGYFAIFQYEVRNDYGAQYGPSIDEYTFFFVGKYVNTTYGSKPHAIYYDKDCTINTGVDVGNQDFLVEPHTTQTFYLKVYIHETFFEFDKIRVVLDGTGELEIIKAK